MSTRAAVEKLRRARRIIETYTRGELLKMFWNASVSYRDVVALLKLIDRLVAEALEELERHGASNRLDQP